MTRGLTVASEPPVRQERWQCYWMRTSQKSAPLQAQANWRHDEAGMAGKQTRVMMLSSLAYSWDDPEHRRVLWLESPPQHCAPKHCTCRSHVVTRLGSSQKHAESGQGDHLNGDHHHRCARRRCAGCRCAGRRCAGPAGHRHAGRRAVRRRAHCCGTERPCSCPVPASCGSAFRLLASISSPR